MESSPECPKGGFPISWAKQAAAIRAPMSEGVLFSKTFFTTSSSSLSSINFATNLPKERPTDATSKLCVKRVCTKSNSGKGITCVLSCSLLKG